MNNIYYVYEYVDPRTSLPFYIGKGKLDRLNRHIRHALNHEVPPKWLGNRHLFYKIKQIISSGYNVIINKIYENLSEEEALDLEIKTIAKYKDILCNFTIGGEGVSGYKFSAESKIKMRMKLLGRPMSDKTRKALYEANKGRKMKKEWTDKGVFMRLKNTYYIKNINTDAEFKEINITKFCREKNLALSTLLKSYKTKIPPKTGKNAGWILYKIESIDALPQNSD